MSITTLAAGRRAADAAISGHEARRRRYLLQAMRWFIELLIELVGETEGATTDDLRLRRPELAHPQSAKGTIPKVLRRARVIRFVGWREATRESSHARPMRIWRLVSRDAALKWLTEHPLPASDGSPPVQRSLFGGEVAR